ncbi:crossover junction endodeoxyribonuclease RuvC [Candidatus Kaiserbacteria bacterium]|nr:crossover junction endodeoxyribonuclease RuvC [Candidatus Kaiserbacteria bacterium]
MNKLKVHSRKLKAVTRVLAIDPGYERVGIAVVEKSKAGEESLVYSECFETDAKEVFETRLLRIGGEIERVIATYAPLALAIEQLYFNSNQKTAMRVAEARGAIIYVCTKHNLRLFEYTPLQIKSAVSGYGKSTKAQVARMLPRLIDMPKQKRRDDEYDAIAIGLTCLASERFR